MKNVFDVFCALLAVALVMVYLAGVGGFLVGVFIRGVRFALNLEL